MTKFMMLVLSATGAPVPLVKRFLVDMRVPCLAWRADGMEYFLAGPGRGADHVAEILWVPCRRGHRLRCCQRSSRARSRRYESLVCSCGVCPPPVAAGRLFGKCSVTVGKE